MTIALGPRPTNVPDPFAGLLRPHLTTRPNLRTGVVRPRPSCSEEPNAPGMGSARHPRHGAASKLAGRGDSAVNDPHLRRRYIDARIGAHLVC